MISSQRLFSLLFLSLLIFQGCSPHTPIHITPKEPVPESFVSPTPAAHQGKALCSWRPWWRTFDNQELDGLIAEALEENLDIRAGTARLLRARAIVKEALAPYFPAVSADYQISRNKQPGYFGDDTGTNYRMSLAASYEVDLWKRIESGAKSARSEARATEEDLLTLYMGISAQVADLYYLICAKEQEKKLIAETGDALEIQLFIAQDQYEQGLVDADEVLDARKELAVTRALYTQIEQEIQKARYALSILLGRYPEAPPEFSSNSLPDLEKAFPVGIPARLLQERPDIRAAYLRLEAADARVAQAIAQRFPSVNLMAQIGRSRTAFSSGDIVGMFWSTAFSAAMSIFEGGKRTAAVERARAETMEAMALYHKAVLQAFKDVEDALMDNWSAQEILAQLKKEEKAHAELYDLALERYVGGLTSYLPAIKSRVQLVEVRRRIAMTRYQAISARISLYRSLGGIWMRDYMEKSLRGLHGE